MTVEQAFHIVLNAYQAGKPVEEMIADIKLVQAAFDA